MKSYLLVGIGDGVSTERLMRKTFEELEEVRNATAGGWTASRRFEELRHSLTGEAKEAYRLLRERDYPNVADLTHPNYEELLRQIVTLLSDHTYPGNRVHDYVLHGIKYVDCKYDDGRLHKPNKVLWRMQCLKTLGEKMQHTMGAIFMSDEQFKFRYWGIFPEKMQE